MLNCRCNGFHSAPGFLSTRFSPDNARKMEGIIMKTKKKKKIVSNNITVNFYVTTQVHGKHFSLTSDKYNYYYQFIQKVIPIIIIIYYYGYVEFILLHNVIMKEKQCVLYVTYNNALTC